MPVETCCPRTPSARAAGCLLASPALAAGLQARRSGPTSRSMRRAWGLGPPACLASPSLPSERCATGGNDSAVAWLARPPCCDQDPVPDQPYQHCLPARFMQGRALEGPVYAAAKKAAHMQPLNPAAHNVLGLASGEGRCTCCCCL